MNSAELQNILELRRTGHSIPEIAKITSRGKTTIWKLVHAVPINEAYIALWKGKQGGSKARAEKRWEIARSQVSELLPELSQSNYLIILASLYWAEGSKKEFTFTNTDPDMIKVLINCLRKLTVSNEDLIVSIRMYEDMVPRKREIIDFWAKIIGIPAGNISRINILAGKKEGKLAYGMCRIRIRKGEKYFKLIQSTIQILKTNYMSS